MAPQARLDRYIERITDAFFIINAEGILTYASSGVSQLVGYSPEELKGRSSLDFIHPDDHPLAIEKQAELLTYPGNRLSHDYRILNKHESYQWMECIFVNMLNIPQVAEILVQMRDVSERKTTELQLQESRELFNLFMSRIPATALIRDDKGRYMFVNETFCIQTGTRMEDVLGKAYEEVFPQFTDQIEETDRICLDLGKEMQYMEKGMDRSGEEKDWIVYKFPIPRSKGRTFIGSLGFDVSRLANAKEAAKHAEDKFKVIFDNAPDAIFIEDEQGTILDANRKACELQGLQLDQLRGKNILDLTPENMKRKVGEQFRELWKGEIQELDSFTWTVKGEEIPVDIHAGRIVHEGREAIILTLRKRT